jgi:mannitol-specific phosphotransferase system IIBC component
MRKIWSMGVIVSFLLSASLLSCQKETDKELKSCSKQCKAAFEQVVQNCALKKSEPEKAKCKMDEMTKYNECVQKCNEGFMKTVK